MDTLNCPRCGKLFKKIRSPVCPTCEKAEEEQFQELRKYLDENRLASITECSDATGIPTKRILHYIREGRLMVPEGMSGLLKCAKCGKDILGGKFCSSCSAKMARNLSESLAAPKDSDSINKKGGFHIGKKRDSGR